MDSAPETAINYVSLLVLQHQDFGVCVLGPVGLCTPPRYRGLCEVLDSMHRLRVNLKNDQILGESALQYPLIKAGRLPSARLRDIPGLLLVLISTLESICGNEYFSLSSLCE